MITREQKEFLLPKAYNAALRAGAAILEMYNGKMKASVNIKKDNTPIIAADCEAHRIIRKYLGQTRIPLLSEEGREMLYAERKHWDLFWMVDPLDGTKEFIKGNGEFTVNIALMVNHRPNIAVVYVPYKKLVYFADCDLGSFRASGIDADPAAELRYEDMIRGAEALPIFKKRNRPLRIAVSRSHNTWKTFEHIGKLRKKYPDAEIIEQGSSYKFCLIAEGTIDYYVRTSDTYEWDTAAGEAILENAGGKTLSLPDNERLLYNKESLANPHFTCRSKWFEM